MAVSDHNAFPMYKDNTDLYYEQVNELADISKEVFYFSSPICQSLTTRKACPTPTTLMRWIFQTIIVIVSFQDVDEPVFDPYVHLDLQVDEK